MTAAEHAATIRKALPRHGLEYVPPDAAAALVSLVWLEEQAARTEAAEAERDEAQDMVLAATDYIARAEAAEKERDEALVELGIERERNPNRVICPKCMANLPCESCGRYSVVREELEVRVAQLEAANARADDPPPPPPPPVPKEGVKL